MKRYILQYASMDDEGVLSMDYLGSFNSKAEAQQQQKRIMDDFVNANSSLADELIKESIGNFQRIAYRNHLTEIQSQIIVLEASQTISYINYIKASTS